jgi:hypothetical protein
MTWGNFVLHLPASPSNCSPCRILQTDGVTITILVSPSCMGKTLQERDERNKRSADNRDHRRRVSWTRVSWTDKSFVDRRSSTFPATVKVPAPSGPRNFHVTSRTSAFRACRWRPSLELTATANVPVNPPRIEPRRPTFPTPCGSIFRGGSRRAHLCSSSPLTPTTSPPVCLKLRDEKVGEIMRLNL